MFPLKDNIPALRATPVTWALLAINVLAYFLWQKGGILNGPPQHNVVDYGWIPYEFRHLGQQCAIVRDGAIGCGESIHGQPSLWLTALTSMFMHGSIIHLGGNMLFLWIFGNNVEDAMGSLRFVVFYLVGGVSALALQTVAAGSGTDSIAPMIGASGAIAAVLGGYIVLYPRARVLTVVFIILFFTLIEVPAIVVLGIWFAQQLLFSYFDLSDPTGGGGVAYFAHIGGFAFGLLAIRLFAQHVNPAYQRNRRAGLAS
jgi:membrane associated rhomboid family serine protease